MRGVATFVPLLLVGGCAGALPRPEKQPPQEIVLDRDDLVIDRDTVVRPGTYHVRDANGDGVLRVVADHVRLKLDGVVLEGATHGSLPDTFEGIGIRVDGAKGVRIEGGAVRGFRIGLRAERAPGLEVIRLDVSDNRAMRLKSTPQREDPADWLWPHENDKGEWETRYGAGISLNDCEDAVVKHCRARTTQNGLLLTRCRSVRVEDNDFSFLSGWGIAMYRSTHCDIVRNRCDFCVRGYSHGIYARGQDSAAILMFEQCSDNLIEGNSGTHSGDGLFLYAGHETTQRTGRGGSNENLVFGNDFSHAVANGIEATFSRGNLFLANVLDGCDHGVWAGYSYETEIRGNTIRDCAHGISIEHGHDNVIERNTISACKLGVHLWWDDDKELLASMYGQHNETASTRNAILCNRIENCASPMRLDGDTKTRVDDGATDSWVRTGRGKWDGSVRRSGFVNVLPADMPRGRGNIVIGEWGPLDPRVPALVPFGPSSEAAMMFRVVGDKLPYRVMPFRPLPRGALSETAPSPSDVAWKPNPDGQAPEVLHLKERIRSWFTGPTWSVTVRIGDRDFAVSGSTVSMKWNVRWWGWQTDPRNDAQEWQKLLASPPLESVTTEELAFDWRGNAPTPKVPSDHFATVAETTLTLPAGCYRIATTSDDGIRVYVDGEVVLEDWTWHAPKELAVERPLTAGQHTIRVEHFELDGHAALHCTIEPLR